MANNLSSNPWAIDTASATTLHAGLAYIRGFSWTGYSASSDVCVITAKDPAGNTITVATLNGDTSLAPKFINYGAPIWVRNFTVPTLTAGVLTVNL